MRFWPVVQRRFIGADILADTELYRRGVALWLIMLIPVQAAHQNGMMPPAVTE
jgi:hypothetical protein